MKLKTFTLSELLIVIGLIGVVAALTIPTLIPLIKDKVNKNKKEVIEKRLIQGLNQLNTLDDGMNGSQYQNSEQFVQALSKYYKMNQICGAADLDKCFPYSALNYSKRDGSTAVKSWSELRNPEDYGLKSEEWHAPAGFISANGTPFVMLLKKDCVMDTGEAIRSIPTDCVQYIYDKNGSNTPNKFDSDLAHSDPLVIGVLMPSGTFDNPIDNYKTYYIPNTIPAAINTCEGSPDRKWDNVTQDGWCRTNRQAAAKKACAMAGYDLPSEVQLFEIFCRAYGYKGRWITSCTTIVKDNELYNKLSEIDYQSNTEKRFWATENATVVRFDGGHVNSYPYPMSVYNVICIR